jgi:hypothetical protein
VKTLSSGCFKHNPFKPHGENVLSQHQNAVVQHISHYILTMYGQRYYAEYKLQKEMIYIISTVISAGVNILLAFWIYRRAKDEGKEPLTWSALTLFFGLLAVILFYLDITMSTSGRIQKVSAELGEYARHQLNN